MSMELANLMCRVTIAVSTLFIAIYLDKIQIYLNKIQESTEFIRRNLYYIKDELRYQDYIREIAMKLDRIANTLDTLDKGDGENNVD